MVVKFIPFSPLVHVRQNTKRKVGSCMGLQGYKIFIDAGHGGTDPGAGANGLVEKTVTLDIAKRLQTRLIALGATTKMSRTTDTALTPQARVSASNTFGADIFVSIHNNIGGGAASGVETWVHENSSSLTNSLASYVNNSMASRLSANNRGIKKAPRDRQGDNIHVIDPANINSWAILPEVLFLDNTTDANKLKSATYLQYAAEAIATGMFNFSNTLPPKI